jgi:hypothetical protein
MDVFRDLWISLSGYKQVETPKYPVRVYYLGDKPPAYCQQCAMNYAEVRARHKATNKCEYFCYSCIKNNTELKNLPVSKKIKVPTV